MGTRQSRPACTPELPDDLGTIAKKYRAYNFPFENLVLEGGGAKGTAYIGAMKVLEEAGIMKSIKRFAGTSAGAATAGLMSIGMTSDEMVAEMGNVDMDRTLMDSPWWSHGPVKLLFYGRKYFKNFGVYRGEEFISWYGGVIYRHLQKHHSTKGLDENINLNQLRNVFGKELCTVTYNLTYGMEMYCHVKTTPLCTVRQAVRMSMSLPGVFEPYKFEKEPDLYIDGGVCANFPIYCYDGWWLSMDDQDSFQRRLEEEKDDVKTTSYFYQQYIEARFQPENVSQEQRKQQLQKTLGLMLYSNTNRKAHQHVFSKRLEVFREQEGRLNNKRPDTKLSRKYQRNEESNNKRVRDDIKAMENENDEKKKKLEKVLKVARNREDMFQRFKEVFPDKEELRDFSDGADSYEVVFDILFAKYKGGPVTADTVKSVYNNWEPFRKKLMEVVPQRIIDTSAELTTKYVELVGQSKPIKEEDVGRCIAIDVDYVGTLDFNMEPADQTFLMRQGALATLAFLEDYVKRNNLQPSNGTSTEHPDNT
ncbi:Hypp42 [Branchiostoma lanceolatum]|uniref:Hypp42 protein n=1 Tax=Branchiostoma lanceolatum TaxID=7740 RepID=A0A8J9YLP6_BRALA|nr:Hypp42 [Branchiostoma lanceolatum]